MPMTSHSYATAADQQNSTRATPRKGLTIGQVPTNPSSTYYTHSPYWYQDAPALDVTAPRDDRGHSAATPYITPELSRAPSETERRTSESSSLDGSTCSGERVYPSTAGQVFSRPLRSPHMRQAICLHDDQTEAPSPSPASSSRAAPPPAYASIHAFRQPPSVSELPREPQDAVQSASTPAVHPLIYHTVLAGACEFLSLPQALPTPLHWPSQRCIESDGSTHRVFIGHVRFETTSEQISFVVQHACGVVPAWVVNHRVGCFVVHLDSAEAYRRVLSFHKRIYFDTVGVWIARTNYALQVLNAEVAAVSDGPRSFSFRRCRLPRGAMVIEPFTDDDAGSPKRVSGRMKPRLQENGLS